MPTPKLTKAKIEQYAAFKCEIECLTIIAACSSLTKKDFLAALRRPNPALGDVGVSNTKADLLMRPRINKLIRDPAGKMPIPPGEFSAATKVAAVVKKACL